MNTPNVSGVFTSDKIKNNDDDKINYYNYEIKYFIAPQSRSISRNKKNYRV